MVDFGILVGFEAGNIVYPAWRLIYFLFSSFVIAGVFAFLQFTTFGMVVRAGMQTGRRWGCWG